MPDDNLEIKITLPAVLKILRQSYPDQSISSMKLSKYPNVYFEVDDGKNCNKLFYDLEKKIAHSFSEEFEEIFTAAKDAIYIVNYMDSEKEFGATTISGEDDFWELQRTLREMSCG